MAAVAETFGVIDFAIYVGGAGFIMLVKYPTPQPAINAPITIFSLNVSIVNYYYIFYTNFVHTRTKKTDFFNRVKVSNKNNKFLKLI